MHCFHPPSQLITKLILIMILGFFTDRLMAADIPLNASNRLGSDGSYYWIIRTPGSYYLDIPESVLNTSNEVAIWIAAGNVTLDGKGKIISGPAAPSTPTGSGVYGIRVNGGQKISNVSVRNLKISNKFYGVIYEGVNNGLIENVNASSNRYGFYFWDNSYSTLRFNIANNNVHSGIVCDADQRINSNNNIVGNVASYNGVNGVFLWLACTNNFINNNALNNNAQMGISLSSGSDGNKIEGNSISGNSSGIWISSANQNSISSNTLSSNINVGIFIQLSTANNIFSNLIQQNQNAGIWLDQATANTIYSNTIIYNRYWGIFNANASSNQLIYNNYFNNLGNVGSSNGGNNFWNISQVGGKNIVGGPYIGGNYWTSLSGSGFSELNKDNNCDGIVDVPYAVGSGNIDALPLRNFINRNKMVSADFNGDGRADLAGLSGAGNVYYSTSLGGWTNIPGVLSQLVAGDFNGDGRADLAGLTSAGAIYYTTNLSDWTNIPGRLANICQ